MHTTHAYCNMPVSGNQKGVRQKYVVHLLPHFLRLEGAALDSSLEEERLPAWGECHAEVVFVLTCDMEIANDTAMAIL